MKTGTQIVPGQGDHITGLDLLFGHVPGWAKLIMFIIFLILVVLLITK